MLTQFWSTHYRAQDPHYWYYVNLEDPNERGYAVIRRLFLAAMAKAVRPEETQNPESKTR